MPDTTLPGQYDVLTQLPHNGVDTSIAAADSLQTMAATLTEAAYQYVLGRGSDGATCDEVEVALGLRHQTASSRLWALERAGRVTMSVTTRPTRSGRKARIYLACP